jgi:hypothetical protein
VAAAAAAIHFLLWRRRQFRSGDFVSAAKSVEPPPIAAAAVKLFSFAVVQFERRFELHYCNWR